MTNIKLSPRLEKIAEKVPWQSILFDVGSDHAYLPCSLVERGICQKAYAADLREGPLQIAKKNIQRYQLEGKVIPLLSDGLEALRDDADCLSIAGMGCYTAIEILSKKSLQQFHTIIVQVNRKSEILREWIAQQHYTILDEEVVKDENFYYEILVFTPHQYASYTKEEVQLGPCLLRKRTSLRDEYWQQRIQEWQYINEAKKENQYQKLIAFVQKEIKSEE